MTAALAAAARRNPRSQLDLVPLRYGIKWSLVVHGRELPDGCWTRVCEDFLYKDNGPTLGDSGEHIVHGSACLLVTVGPEVAVSVEGLRRGLVAEPSLDGLYRAAPADE